MTMTHLEALQVLTKHRGERVVITTMTSVGIWPQLSDGPLDFSYIPSAMGHGPSLGMGLALAQPERGVIVVNGEGCTLMSLGNLVSIAHEAPNLFVLLMDNELYEVTGGQPTAGAGKVDFAGLAKAAGIERVYHFPDLESWTTGAEKALSGTGPVVIWLKLEGRLGQKTPKAPRPMEEQIERLQQALNVPPLP